MCNTFVIREERGVLFGRRKRDPIGGTRNDFGGSSILDTYFEACINPTSTCGYFQFASDICVVFKDSFNESKWGVPFVMP